MTGVYDGRVFGGVGGSADAFIDLTDASSDVTGYAFVMQRGLTVDAGFLCGREIDVPVSVFPVDATQGRSNFSATGNLVRNVRVVGFMPVEATISYDFQLDATDLETPRAEMLLDLPWPCLDTRLNGRFIRRPL